MKNLKTIETQLQNFYFQVKGGEFKLLKDSMLPVLQNGYKVKVEPINPEKIRMGDIVVFGNEKLVCHRVIGKFRREGVLYFLQKGDNSPSFGEASAEQIIGKVTGVIDENSKKIEERLWQKNPFLFFPYNFLGFFYTICHSVRYVFFSRRKNLITHLLGSAFWRGYYFVLRLITKQAPSL